jgi:anti-anti-sigma factor
MNTVSNFREETRGQTLIVTPLKNLGEFEFEWIEEATDHFLSELEKNSVRNLVIDLRNTDFYGSTALSLFVKLWKQVGSRQGKMAFCHASPHELEVLRITHLDHSWPICETLDEAIKAVES